MVSSAHHLKQNEVNIKLKQAGELCAMTDNFTFPF